jgi:hypothetical protein
LVILEIKSNPAQFCNWENLGDVYPEASLREKLDAAGREKEKENILKLRKPWRMNWKSQIPIEGRIEIAFKDGKHTGTALRGVKQCPSCRNIWDRDLVAAKNISFIFVYMVFNELKRPFLFRRFKSKPSVGVAHETGSKKRKRN